MKDPFVVIAIVTSLPANACTSTTIIHQASAKVLTKSKPCELDKQGLKISTVQVRRSEALAHHDIYVALPSAHATRMIQEQTESQIEKMMYLKRDAFRQMERKEQVVPGSSDPCQNDKDKGDQNWLWNVSAFGDPLNEQISWNESSDCSRITIYYATVSSSTGSVFNPDYWDRIRYANIDIGEGCRYIGTNFLQSTVNRSDNPNYTFEFWINNSAGCGLGSTHTFYDLGLS